MKKTVYILIGAILTFGLSAQAASVLQSYQGGTGIGTATAGDVNKCLVVSDDSPFTYTLGSCGTGGGSSQWATSTINTFGIVTAGAGYVGIGTSTPLYTLHISSSTAPQIALGAGAGVAMWAFRNAGGNLYFATTTVAGTSTSTPFLTILNSGTLAIGTTTPTRNSVLNIVGTTTATGQIVSITSSTTAASTQNIDWSTGNTQSIMLTSAATNIVMNSTSSNPISGGKYILDICQDPVGSRTITWADPTVLRWGSFGTTTISSTASTCSQIGFIYKNLNGNPIYVGVASSTGSPIK
jgi:hypothetical protein